MTTANAPLTIYIWSCGSMSIINIVDKNLDVYGGQSTVLIYKGNPRNNKINEERNKIKISVDKLEEIILSYDERTMRESERDET